MERVKIKENLRGYILFIDFESNIQLWIQSLNIILTLDNSTKYIKSVNLHFIGYSCTVYTLENSKTNKYYSNMTNLPFVISYPFELRVTP